MCVHTVTSHPLVWVLSGALGHSSAINLVCSNHSCRHCLRLGLLYTLEQTRAYQSPTPKCNYTHQRKDRQTLAEYCKAKQLHPLAVTQFSDKVQIKHFQISTTAASSSVVQRVAPPVTMASQAPCKRPSIVALRGARTDARHATSAAAFPRSRSGNAAAGGREK